MVLLLLHCDTGNGCPRAHNMRQYSTARRRSLASSYACRCPRGQARLLPVTAGPSSEHFCTALCPTNRLVLTCVLSKAHQHEIDNDAQPLVTTTTTIDLKGSVLPASSAHAFPSSSTDEATTYRMTDRDRHTYLCVISGSAVPVTAIEAAVSSMSLRVEGDDIEEIEC